MNKINKILILLVFWVGLTGCVSNSEPTNVLGGSQNSVEAFELRQKAQIAYQQSRWIDAVRLYQGLVEKTPTDSGAWFRLGNIYAQQGALQRAIHAYENSLKHDSGQPKAWFNLSTAYLLNAQSSMLSAHNQLRESDPAKTLIAERLSALSALVHGRFEEGVSPTAYSR